MQKKITLRFLIGIFLILALYFGYRTLKEFTIDPDLGDFASHGYILAIQQAESGKPKAVLFDPEEELIPAPDSGKDDHEDIAATWSADGQRVFIASNRESTAYNIYRWNPAKKTVERRSTGSRSQSAPWFDQFGDEPESVGLITSGGNILEYNPRFGTAVQILPPTDKLVSATPEGGSVSSMEAIYGNIGDSFRLARYGPTKQDIFAVMRSHQGEVLIYSSTVPDENGRMLPQILMRASKLDISRSNNGSIGVMVRRFMFPDPENIPPQFVKDGKPFLPYLNGVLKLEFIDGKLTQTPLILTKKPEEAFGEISISPDGSKIAIVVGALNKQGTFTPSGLITMPFAADGIKSIVGLDQGSISMPSWSPDSSKIVYIKSEDGFSNIYTVAAIGGAPDQVGEDGNFSQPYYSPQPPRKED